MFLITGCGRSGTKYIVEVLAAVGIEAGHEKPGKHGIVDWHLVLAKPEEYDFILHQVRHPLRTIESMHSAREPSWKFICERVMDIRMDMSILERCMAYWYYWNLLAEKNAWLTYRVEDLDAVINQVGGVCLGKAPGRKAKNKMAKVPANMHTRRNGSRGKSIPKLGWKELREANLSLANAIHAMAKRYGYGGK